MSIQPQRTPRALSNDCRAPFALSVSPAVQNLRSALTLIELLVVIVILTTLVAGVIPLLSPNNDTRKIREATRMLQTYIMQAQAEAARTGRPQGIGFQESSPGSGVALDVFRLEVPVPFAGFSSASAVRIIREEPAGPPVTFNYYIQFILADTATGILPTLFPPVNDYTSDPIPPRLVRKNDSVLSSGFNVYLTDATASDLDPDGNFYIATNKSLFEIEIDLTAGNTLAFVQTYTVGTTIYSLTAPKPFKFIRQPVNTAEQPLQLPASIAIDMQGSVAEGADTNLTPGAAFPIDSSLFNTGGVQNSVGIMFSPSGSVSDVIFNGVQLTNVSRIALLLGRVENGGLAASTEWTIATGASNDELSELQEKVNWLNLDSRWLSIAPNSGRAVASDNAFVDARPFGTEIPKDQAEEQIEAAHGFAHEMRSEGAGK